MIKVQSPNWRKIVLRLKMIDLRSNTHGCELIIAFVVMTFTFTCFAEEIYTN